MVSLTRRAAEKIRLNKGERKYVRLAAVGNSNSHVAYGVDFTDDVTCDDILYMSYGIKILVGSSTRKYFEDLKVDYNGQNGDAGYSFDSSDVLAAEI
jgi:Fe-S cluster assembly iron-binding protein IscA